MYPFGSRHLPEPKRSILKESVANLGLEFHHAAGSNSSPTEFLKSIASFIRSSHLPIVHIKAKFSPHFPRPPRQPLKDYAASFTLDLPLSAVNSDGSIHLITSKWDTKLPFGSQTLVRITSEHVTPADDFRYLKRPEAGQLPAVFSISDLLPHLEKLHPVFASHYHLFQNYQSNHHQPHKLSGWLSSTYDKDRDSTSPDRLEFLKISVVSRKTRLTPENLQRSPRRDSVSYSYQLKRQHHHEMYPEGVANQATDTKGQILIGMGSNMGDRLHHIESACQMLEDKGINIIKTSAMYETAPMYLTDQAKFLNSVCSVSINFAATEGMPCLI